MRQKDVTEKINEIFTLKRKFENFYKIFIFKENLLKIFFKEKNDAKFCFYRHSFLIT